MDLIKKIMSWIKLTILVICSCIIWLIGVIDMCIIMMLDIVKILLVCPFSFISATTSWFVFNFFKSPDEDIRRELELSDLSWKTIFQSEIYMILDSTFLRNFKKQ